jgi:hypothetical protein
MAFNKVQLTDAVNRSCDKFGYSDPRNLLRRLGFDAKIVDEILEEDNTTMPQRIRVRDDDPISAETVMQFIDDALEGMPESEVEHLADQLGERLLVDDPAAAQDRKRRRAADARMGRRSRRLGRDAPEPFLGMPRVGGQDPLSVEAKDRVASRRALTGAMDSAGVKSFDQLFPGAAHIRISG